MINDREKDRGWLMGGKEGEERRAKERETEIDGGENKWKANVVL